MRCQSAKLHDKFERGDKSCNELLALELWELLAGRLLASDRGGPLMVEGLELVGDKRWPIPSNGKRWPIPSNGLELVGDKR